MIYTKKNIQDLRKVLENTQKSGKKVIWTNGCFDIMHPGHMKNFEICKELADIVVVGMNGDASPYWQTKPWRPINDENFRSEMLTHLKNVDYVYIFDDETPADPVDILKPDMILKGWDYILESKKNLVEKRWNILDLTKMYQTIIEEWSEKYKQESGYMSEARVAVKNGGKVFIVPLIEGLSTSNIVEKLQSK